MMKMVYKPFCLMFALIISKTASQNLTVTSACIETGTTVQLTCKTTDFASAVLFYLNGINKGGCTTISCGTSISGYTTPTQSGTSTEMTISNYNHSRDGGDWTCSYGVSTSSPYTVELGNCEVSTEGSTEGPISQMSTSIAQERTTSVNSIFEFGNITIPMITGSITPTSDILSLTISYLNTGSTNFNANTESTNFYTKTGTITSYANAETTNVNEIIETTTFYANIETTNVDANTKVNEIQTKTLTEILLLSISGINSCIQQKNSNTESSLMSTAVIDQISYSSKMEDPSFSSNQYLSETTVTLPKISVSSQLPLSLIDTRNHFIYTSNTLITSYLDDTRLSFDDFTGGFQTFSQNYAASASTSLANFFQSTTNHLSLQTTEYYATMQTEFTSYVTTPFYESQTDNAATGIYSKEIMTSGKSFIHTSVMPSKTQLASMNDIQDSTTDFQSTYFEPFSQSTDVVFSSEISQYLLSTLQSMSLLLPLNTKVNASGVGSYMKTTNMSTFKSLSGLQTMDLSHFTNPSSILISAVLPDFKTTWLTTTIHFNGTAMPSMIKPSSQQTNSSNAYIEIDTSFEDSSFSFGSFSGSLTSNYPVMKSLSSGVSKSISTLSTNAVQSGFAEKNKNIIFISTISAVLTIIVVILLIIFAKVYMSKNNEDDSKSSSPPNTALPDYSFTGKIIYPLLNTSTTSFKMHPYEHNWDDIV